MSEGSGDPELDALLREVDDLRAARDWDGLLALRERARRSHERGRQHWPAASRAEYVLAREAPGPFAACVVEEGAGLFALGPLAEVAASTHTWGELAEHLPPGPLRSIVAFERVVRGEDLCDDPSIDSDVLPVPLVLQPWEPAYPVAEYRDDEADFDGPPLPVRSPVALPASFTGADTPDEVAALREVVATWLAQSNGAASAVGVEGDGLAAIAALGVASARTAPLSTADAFAWIAWAAASGGARGRRRGMAWGRWAAWSLAATLADCEPDELGDVVGELRWFAWDAEEPETGWSLRIAVEDPDAGLAWAVAATDAEL